MSKDMVKLICTYAGESVDLHKLYRDIDKREKEIDTVEWFNQQIKSCI